jgi:hypothetical protein
MTFRRCNGTKALVTEHHASPAEFGKDKIDPCPGCPDCFDLSAKSARIGEFLTVEMRYAPGSSSERKTGIWFVYGDDDAHVSIGQVRWYGAWRQYTFWPMPSSVFHAGCLEDIVVFLRRLNDAHRAQRRKQTP